MIFIAAISFAGCYTIMWTPDKAFPSADETTATTHDGYYNDQYYGDYSYYYEYPWWYSIIPPTPYYTPGSAAYVRDTSGAVQSLRNGMGGRGTAGRSILHTAPATRTFTNSSDSGSSANTTAGNSGNNNSNYNRTETTSSGSGSNDSTSRSSSSQREGSNSARNNNGGRNNNGRK